MPYDKPKVQYVDMEDGRSVLDLYNTLEDTALFSYIMDRPQHRKAFEELVEARDTSGLYKWMDSLDRTVLTNGAQKSYLADVFRDCVFSKFPQEKEKYEKLKSDINAPNTTPRGGVNYSEPSM